MPALTDRLRAEWLPALARGGQWWAGELAGLIPERLRQRFRYRARADIRPGRAGVSVVRSTKGRGERLDEAVAITAFTDAQWRELVTLTVGHSTRLLLEAPLALGLTLRLPKTARPYLRTALPAQLAEHAPLPLDQILWMVRDTRLEGDTLFVRVIMAKRSLIDTIAAGFAGQDAKMPPVFAEIDGETWLLHRGLRRMLSPPWIVATAIMAATPLLLLALLQVLIVDQRDRVAGLEHLARPKMATERRLRADATAARDLNLLFAMPDATSVIEDLADRLPPSSHAVNITRNDDGSLLITLETTDPGSIAAALRDDPKLQGLRPLDATRNADDSARVRLEMPR